MNGSHLAIGAVAALAALGSMAKRGSRARYVGRGRVTGMDPAYEFEFESECTPDQICLREDAYRALMGADYDEFWKERVETEWRWGNWRDGQWDDHMEIEESIPLSIRDVKHGGGHRPPLLVDR
jgi:hypothetical protein